MTEQIHDIASEIRALAAEAGASACGIVPAEPVDAEADALYCHWIADGRHGSMDYCARYQDVRSDPRLLLDGARTLIVCAYNYYNPDGPMALGISRYAWGTDYHHVLKERLRRLAAALTERHGGECRVMVDTAPLRERYWAQRAGVGFIGLNNQLIVPGVGSYVFLGEVLWTGSLREPRTIDTVDGDGDGWLAPPPQGDGTDTRTGLYGTLPGVGPGKETGGATATAGCLSCMACVKACPGHALDGRGGCDARRCISYLTIEHRGDLPADARLGRSCYGCDICQQVCPHNAAVSPTAIPEFAPDPALRALTASDLRQMTPSHFRRLTRHSAISRVTLPQLIRNLDHPL